MHLAQAKRTGEGFFEKTAVETSFSAAYLPAKKISAFSEKSCMPRERRRTMTSSKNGRKQMRPNRLQSEQHKPLFGLVVALMCSCAFIPSRAAAVSLPSCSGLAAQLLAGEGVSAATSAIQPAAGTHRSYCLVNITVSELAGPKDGYLPGQKQMIKVGIGLPLSPADGGTGGSIGAWNERIQDLGGGGYAGAVGIRLRRRRTRATSDPSTDTGHPASAGGTFLP